MKFDSITILEIKDGIGFKVLYGARLGKKESKTPCFFIKKIQHLPLNMEEVKKMLV